MEKVEELSHGSQYTYYKLKCRCQECTDGIKKAIKDNNEKRKSRKAARLSILPLLEFLPKEFSFDYRRSISKWEQRGLTVYEADRICTKYGFHPFLVYGNAWYDDMWGLDE
jgi:hypothetical protein